MNLNLVRTRFSTDGIFGVLKDEKGNQIAVTLEHSYDCKPKISEGTYTCTRRKSPHFGCDVFLIENVPGHSFCEIHVGCFNRDSDGCVLIGEQVVGTMIDHSRDTFKKFMNENEKGVTSFQLKVTHE